MQPAQVERFSAYGVMGPNDARCSYSLVEYTRTNSSPSTASRSRKDYIKRVAKDFTIDAATGQVIKKSKCGSEKIVVTSIEVLDKVVTAALSNGSPLSARGINVRLIAAILCVTHRRQSR